MKEENEVSFSLSGLSKLYNGNKDYIEQTILVFIEQAKSDSDLLKLAFEERSGKNIAAIAHKMKAGFRLFESEDVANKLEELEYIAKKENVDFDRVSILVADVLRASDCLGSQLKSIDYSEMIIN